MQVGDESKPQRKVAVIVEQKIDTLLRNELSAGQIWFLNLCIVQKTYNFILNYFSVNIVNSFSQ